MNHLCCCSSCKPRYKRVVDHIYPRMPPYDVPVSGNMQKLTFYSIFHPEKLNRIGIYLVQRLSRDLGRQKVADVKVAVDAIDQLLKSCHGSPSINQFIESFLLMVQRLLETNDPQMEKLATDLFVRFSGIEEDSPSYHRQYDFFISKFSSMCHANRGGYVRSQRFNGLRGLRGVIWKSASDDLQANIWEKQHMNKIIPSILFNFQDENDELEDQRVDHTTAMLFGHYPEEQNGSIAEAEPRNLALQCLRELFQKCSFGSLKSVLEPVFRHFDLHNKWDPPPSFAIKTFKAILYSIQSQNSYFVIQELINQLEQVQNGESNVRVGMATVLANIVSIAGTSIGPLLLAIFNSLLKLLRSSVEFQQSKQCVDLEKERLFQNTLINSLGDFASALPDYQKVEIMMFTAGSIPNAENTVFTDAFLRTLLQLQLTRDAEVRLIAHQIFQTLLDRHDNQQKLEHLLLILPEMKMEDLPLIVEKCSRQDALFMRRHIHVIVSTLFRSVTMSESDQSVTPEKQLFAFLCSMALLLVEVGNDETQVELFRLAFALQQYALDEQISEEKAVNIHNLVSRYMSLSSQLASIPALCQHVQQVINLRAQRAHPLLNILNIDKPISNVNNIQIKLDDEKQSQTNPKEVENEGAFSPPSGKAPIAHMDSEEDFLPSAPGSKTNTSRSQKVVESNGQMNVLPTENDKELLFCAETAYDAIKESNKESQRLLQPFKPITVSKSMITSFDVSSVATGQKSTQKRGSSGTQLAAPDLPSTDKSKSTTSTSGGLLFSSPLNRNQSAIEMGGDVCDQNLDEFSSNLRPIETDETKKTLSHQSSVDTVSVGSSSVDWSPPDTAMHSRRNTVFSGQKNLNLPITVEQLRILANTPLDVAEEERRDQALE
uniref:Protein EFR3 homolog B n=1 Tax=Meloidogyne hapla TaxID=6305 RepID=A0A1I8B7P0_MELHA